MSRYRELGLLAEGGMALIAQAARDDGSTVVIKRVRPPFCFDPSFLRLFSDEAAVNAALDHENIVRLLDKGEDEAGPYLVFEHVDGTDLGVVLEHCGKIEVECALAVGIPLFKALQAAHSHALHVVHRDVSPGNVLIASDGAVKLADFGVAWFSMKNEATVAGEMKGKFAYMAPEQTRGEKVDARADLFSAGIVLWEALSGKRLFDGPTDADVVAAVRTQDAARLDNVPPKLADVVARLLAKDPAQRPSTAAEVAAELQSIAVELGFDEGLSRHAARLARMAPRREVKEREIDQRRRTQRVIDADGAMVVRRDRNRRAPAIAAAGVVAVAAIAAAAAWSNHNDVVVTPLPDVKAATLAIKPPDPPAPMPKPTHVDDTPKPTHVDDTPKPTHDDTPKPIEAHVDVKPLVDEPRPPKPSVPKELKLAAANATPKAIAAAPVVADVKPDAAIGFGKLSVSVKFPGWAAVSVDGKPVKGETPLIGYRLLAGHHTVTLDNPGLHATKSFDVDIPVDGLKTIKVEDMAAP